MLNVVVPVFLMAGVGFVARRHLQIDQRPITRLSLYVFVPALLFHSLLTAPIASDEIVRIGVYTVLLTCVMLAIGMVGSRGFRATRSEASGLALAVSFSNAANYGLPVVLFAFGQEGFDRAAIFVVFSTTLTFTLAVFVAARGRLRWRQALLPVVQLPVVWAAAAAVLLRSAGVDLPLPAGRAVAVLSAGAIPIVVVLLGMQIASIQLRRVRAPALVACVAKLGLAPAVGLALVTLLGPEALTARVLVLEAAMPTAVNVALLASEYDAEPELVSSITLLTTALSLVTVTAWVAWLQGM